MQQAQNKSLIPTLELNVPDEWDYEESIKRVKPKIKAYQELTLDVGGDLLVARIKTYGRGQGNRTDLTSSHFARGWVNYCGELGLHYHKVDRDLKRMFPSIWKIYWPKTKEVEKGLEYIDPDIKIVHGDFRDICNTLEDESIDHIITDPPYPEEYLPLWSDLAEHALRILKPGGFCITLSGKAHLPQVLWKLENHLSYYWTGALIQTVPAGVHPVKINTLWKPILIHYKEPKHKQENYVFDTIKGKGREKDSHEWQQSTDFSDAMIERFTNQGDYILDPFGGSGTTAISCRKMKRRCMIIDIDENCINMMNQRLLLGEV